MSTCSVGAYVSPRWVTRAVDDPAVYPQLCGYVICLVHDQRAGSLFDYGDHVFDYVDQVFG